MAPFAAQLPRCSRSSNPCTNLRSVTVFNISNIIKMYQILNETSRAAPVAAWKEWQNADVNVASLGLVDAWSSHCRVVVQFLLKFRLAWMRPKVYVPLYWCALNVEDFWGFLGWFWRCKVVHVRNGCELLLDVPWFKVMDRCSVKNSWLYFCRWFSSWVLSP